MAGVGGIVWRSVEMIFKAQSSVKMACFEIHVETVKDLLLPDNSQANLMTNMGKWKPNEFDVKDLEGVELLIKNS